MSVLLRHPASVPALFSRAMDADLPAVPPAPGWRRLTTGTPLLSLSAWVTLMLIDVPLVKAATAIVDLALPG